MTKEKKKKPEVESIGESYTEFGPKNDTILKSITTFSGGETSIPLVLNPEPVKPKTTKKEETK